MKKITGRLRLEVPADDQGAQTEWFGLLGTLVYKARDLGWDVDDIRVEVVEAEDGPREE